MLRNLKLIFTSIILVAKHTIPISLVVVGLVLFTGLSLLGPLVGSALSMLRHFHFSNWADVGTVRQVLLLTSVLLFLHNFRSGFCKVSFTPIGNNIRFHLLLGRVTFLHLNLLDLVLSLGCLFSCELLILLFTVLVKFPWASLAGFAHFLSHNLTKGTVLSRHDKHSLRFLVGFLRRLFF